MSNHQIESQRLEMIFGSMTSGKSSELARRLRVKSVYKTVLAVNTVRDVRYGDDGIITHDGHKVQATRVEKLSDLLTSQDYMNADVVAIDESQFFPGLKDFIVDQLKTTNKTFILAGLIGDRHKNLFGEMYKLLPHAEKIDFLQAVCKRCGNGTPASFTAALVNFSGQEKVGGAEMYEAVCRVHFQEIEEENIRNSK